jgi:hypothetical protein
MKRDLEASLENIEYVITESKRLQQQAAIVRVYQELDGRLP